MGDTALMSPPTGPHSNPFSVARMRGGLGMFAAGKVVSGLIGLAWLLTLVRALPIPDYGGYVVLLALLEVLLLTSNAGAYPFAQRYITEARLLHNLQRLPSLVWCSLAYRLFTLVIVALVAMYLARPLAELIGQPMLAHVLPIYVLVIIFEGAARYLDLVFESLLEQGKAQLCAVLRNGGRLAVVSFWLSHGVDLRLDDVVHAEAATSGFGLIFSVLVIGRALRAYRATVSAQTSAPDSFTLRRLMSFSLPLYFSQCLTQLYSPDAIKLIVSRVLSVADAAAFGFAHALSYVFQRYLPATLLIGLIRPMLVAKRASNAPDQELVLVGNLILKINLFMLLPLAALFAVAGNEFTALASGGKFKDAGPLLFMLSLLLVLNGMHVVLSTLATAIEDRRAVLVGTLLSVPGIVVGTSLVPTLGLLAMVVGLWVSELLWCGFTLWFLRQRGFAFQIDAAAWLKLFAAAVFASLTGAGSAHLLSLTGQSWLLANALIIMLVYALACVIVSPLSVADRQMLRRLLPARWQRT